MFSKISSVLGGETWDTSCDTIGFSAAGAETETRELDPTAVAVWTSVSLSHVESLPMNRLHLSLLEGGEEGE